MVSSEVREQVAGSTKSHLHEWYEVTSDPVILQNVEGYRLEFDSPPIQNSIPRPYHFNVELSEVIDKEVSSLLTKEVIHEVTDVTNHFVSNIFLQPKPEGKFL